jgi:kynurenine formamidase
VEELQRKDIPAGNYEIMVLPIKAAGHDASPARAVMRKVGP